MEDRFSAAEIHARQRPSLVRKLREFSMGDPEGIVDKLKVIAEAALPPPDSMLSALQRSLNEETSLYNHLSTSVNGLDTDIAKQLASTPGAMLTTIPGIGLRWAPGLYAELGDPIRRRNVHSMAALGGIVPRIKQSGGPNKPAVVRHRSKKCSRYLKHALMSGAVSMSQYGHPEICEAYQFDKNAGRDARTRLAKNLLRVSLYMIDHHSFYLPPSMHRNSTHDQRRKYYVAMWPKVLMKWRDRGAINAATAEESTLRQWRDMAQELYDVELSLKPPQHKRK
jgi:transposase